LEVIAPEIERVRPGVVLQGIGCPAVNDGPVTDARGRDV